MLTHPTVDRLRALRLRAMADAYLAQHQDAGADSRWTSTNASRCLVDAEHLSRENRKLARYLKEAKLRIAQACLEDLDYAPRRELDRALIRQLATGRWIVEHRNVLITGANRRRQDLRRVRPRPAGLSPGLSDRSTDACPRLFQELALARADGTYATLLGPARPRSTA